MPSSTKYSAVATKIKVLYGRLLQPEDYRELARKSSVADVAAYLKDTEAYAPVLANVNEPQIHRGQLEKAIRRALFRDINRLSHFLSSNAKKFIQEMTMRYEIEFIKEYLRHLVYEKDRVFSPDIEYYAEISSRLDIGRLSTAKSYEQFVEMLRHSPYHRLLSRYEEGNLNLFVIETGLDVLYIETMLKRKDKYLTGRDVKYVQNSLGIETDLSNILAVLRAKTYFEAEEQIVYSMIVPSFYQFSKEALLSLVRAKSMQEVHTVLRGSKYRDVFRRPANGFYDQNIKNYLYSRYRAAVSDGSSIGVVLSFIRLKEIEISNIIAVVEGIRYQLSPEETLRYMVGLGG